MIVSQDEKSRRHTLCPEFLAKRSFASDDDDESEVDDTFGLEARGSCDDISRDERFSQSLVRSRIQPPGRRGSRVAKLPSRLDALDMPRFVSFHVFCFHCKESGKSLRIFI